MYGVLNKIYMPKIVWTLGASSITASFCLQHICQAFAWLGSLCRAAKVFFSKRKDWTINDLLVVNLLKCYVRLGNGLNHRCRNTFVASLRQLARRRKASKNELLDIKSWTSSPVAWELVAMPDQVQSAAFWMASRYVQAVCQSTIRAVSYSVMAVVCSKDLSSLSFS